MALTLRQRIARRPRLKVLADFLENDVAKRLDGTKFDMGEWGRVRLVEAGSNCFGGRVEYEPAVYKVPGSIAKTSECGFVGCAAGWGYYCPALVKAGIRRVFNNEYGSLLPDEDLLAEFFGLSRSDNDWDCEGDEFRRCFSPAGYAPTHGENAIRFVAEKLRAVAAESVNEVEG